MALCSAGTRVHTRACVASSCSETAFQSARGDRSSDELPDDNVGVKRARSNDRSHIVRTWTSRIYRDRRGCVARGRNKLRSRVMDASACSLGTFGAPALFPPHSRCFSSPVCHAFATHVRRSRSFVNTIRVAIDIAGYFLAGFAKFVTYTGV